VFTVPVPVPEQIQSNPVAPCIFLMQLNLFLLTPSKTLHFEAPLCVPHVCVLSGISGHTKRHIYIQLGGILLYILEISDSNIGPDFNYYD
jgi:hypothetical protein